MDFRKKAEYSEVVLRIKVTVQNSSEQIRIEYRNGT